MNVFKSDAVIWWAASFRTPSSVFDKMLHLSKSQGFTMNHVRSHSFREAVSDLRTVTMHLQDAWTRFPRPAQNRPSCPRDECVYSHPCVSRIPELLRCPCTEQSSKVSSCTSCSIALSLRYFRKLHQPQCPSTRIHQNSDIPCSASWKTHTRIPRVFNRTLDPHCNSRVAATIFDVSSPISIGHHHDRTLRSARNSKNIKIATNNHVAR